MTLDSEDVESLRVVLAAARAHVTEHEPDDLDTMVAVLDLEERLNAHDRDALPPSEPRT